MNRRARLNKQKAKAMIYKPNAAEKILQALNVYGAMLGKKPKQKRIAQKHKAGDYGKGLRNWITRKQKESLAV